MTILRYLAVRPAGLVALSGLVACSALYPASADEGDAPHHDTRVGKAHKPKTPPPPSLASGTAYRKGVVTVATRWTLPWPLPTRSTSSSRSRPAWAAAAS
jgi:hypothetical protein